MANVWNTFNNSIWLSGSDGHLTYLLTCRQSMAVSHLPIPGGHLALAHRFVNPSLSFTVSSYTFFSESVSKKDVTALRILPSDQMGWNYWYTWSIGKPITPILPSFFISWYVFWFGSALPTETTAAGILINYWNSSINNSVWIGIVLIVVSVTNLGGAK